MASKVLVPAPPFTKLQVKKSPADQSGSSYIISGSDAVARVAHLEHSVRFLQEQHRLMLSGLHAEIEALRERNRDLQFQLIFNKESSAKTSPPATDDAAEANDEANLKREVARLEREAGAARGEARASEARALQLQGLVDAQAQKLRELELATSSAGAAASVAGAEGAEETRGELRARLADAERLVRRLRADAERQRRELQCMKNSLHASLRATGLDPGYYQRTYHLPQVHAPEFWREPLREEFSGGGVRVAAAGCGAGGGRRPLTLPELAGQQIHRPAGYANHHTRPRANGYEHKNRKGQATNGEAVSAKSPDEHTEAQLQRLQPNTLADISRVKHKMDSMGTCPELKVVFTRVIPHGNVSNGQGTAGVAGADGAGGCRAGAGAGARPRRHHHRKHATDHT